MTTLALSHKRQSMSDLAQTSHTLHDVHQYLRLALSARTELKESYIVRAYSWLQDQSFMLRFLLRFNCFPRELDMSEWVSAAQSVVF